MTWSPSGPAPTFEIYELGPESARQPHWLPSAEYRAAILQGLSDIHPTRLGEITEFPLRLRSGRRNLTPEDGSRRFLSALRDRYTTSPSSGRAQITDDVQLQRSDKPIHIGVQVMRIPCHIFFRTSYSFSVSSIGLRVEAACLLTQ